MTTYNPTEHTCEIHGCPLEWRECATQYGFDDWDWCCSECEMEEANDPLMIDVYKAQFGDNNGNPDKS